MDNKISRVYKCYMGKDLWTRTNNIIFGIKHHELSQFFKEYSTEIDSILDFIRRGEEKGLSYFL